jgi:uncharacterized protein
MDALRRTGGPDSASTPSSYPDNQTATVQSSETQLAEVAQRLGIPLESLIAANPQIDPNKIQGGQELKLPELPKESEAPTPARTSDSSSSGAQSKLAEQSLGGMAVKAHLDAQLYFGPGPGPGPTGGGGTVKSGQSAKLQAVTDQLQEAAFNNDTKTMEALMKTPGLDLNAKGSDGMTPLMHAAMGGNKQALKLLTDKGARVDEQTTDGKTALMKAAYLGQMDSVDFLIQNKAKVDLRDKDQNTALIIASKAGSSDAVTALLAAKADPNAMNKDDRTALMEAARNGDSKTTVALAQAKNIDPDIKDKNGKTALMELIDRTPIGDKPDVAGAHAIIAASVKRMGDASGLEQLDKPGGSNAMMQAASKGYKDIVVSLAKAKANPDVIVANNRTAMMELIANMPSGQKLTDKEAQALVNASSNLDAKDSSERTIMMQAASKQQTELVIALAKKGADPDLQDKLNKRTALMDLIEAGNPDPKAMKALIDASSNLDVRDTNGRTALMEAARTGDHGAVRALSEAKDPNGNFKVDINLKDSNGMSPLMLAAKNRNKWGVRFLLDRDWAEAGQGKLRKADPSQYSAALAQAQQALKDYKKDPDHTAYGEEEFGKIIDLLKDAIANP